MTTATLLLALSLLTAAGLRSQASDTAPRKNAVPAADIFSGTVTRVTDQSITVVRKVLGKPPVTREFSRDAGTTVEGKLGVKARVTVRYKAGEEDGFVALHIIVR